MNIDNDLAIDLVKKNLIVKPWLTKAREQYKLNNALVNGEKFVEELITKIEKIESEDRAVARKKYSKDIRDVCKRIYQPRKNVFSASGGSTDIEIKSESELTKFAKYLSEFKGQKSIKHYLSEVYFQLMDVDPNGLIFLEYKEDLDIYPTYKSINDIRHYESNGQLVDYVIFEPKKKIGEDNQPYNEWRVVGDDSDIRIKQIGSSYSIIEDKTFNHFFGKAPAIIISPNNVLGSELRISGINDTVKLLEDYARDKSILTIYKFQNGFPKHGRYASVCKSCSGTRKDGEGTCKSCNGKGEIRVNDVTDTTIIPIPREGEPMLAPNLEWFNSPDLKTWERYNEDLKQLESVIEETVWGTKKSEQGKSETATGRYIDVQPVMNKLNEYTDTVEWVQNRLANWVYNWMVGRVEKPIYYHAYGRRFIMESPDTILDNYEKAREKGANSTILDKLLEEFILSKYQNNPTLLNEMLKKKDIEPYVHLSVDEVSRIFGNEEAYKKVMFVDFWEQADPNKTKEELKKEFIKFTENNKLITNTQTNE